MSYPELTDEEARNRSSDSTAATLTFTGTNSGVRTGGFVIVNSATIDHHAESPNDPIKTSTRNCTCFLSDGSSSCSSSSSCFQCASKSSGIISLTPLICTSSDSLLCGVSDSLLCGVSDSLLCGVSDSLLCGVSDSLLCGVSDSLLCGVSATQNITDELSLNEPEVKSGVREKVESQSEALQVTG